jgi:hypothetical protein
MGKPGFIDSILNFELGTTKIDDEMAFGVLFASFFGNEMAIPLLPKP